MTEHLAAATDVTHSNSWLLSQMTSSFFHSRVVDLSSEVSITFQGQKHCQGNRRKLLEV